MQFQATSILKISFEGPARNRLGIGSRVQIFADSLVLTYENFLTRGYLSSVAPTLTVGLGAREVVDSVVVHWPGGNIESRANVKAGEELVFRYEDSRGWKHLNQM